MRGAAYLKALGQCVVHDKANIWLVNPHAKGNRCAHNLQTPTVPVSLYYDALLRGHASMIVLSLKLATLLYIEHSFTCFGGV